MTTACSHVSVMGASFAQSGGSATHADLGGSTDEEATDLLMTEAADRIVALTAERDAASTGILCPQHTGAERGMTDQDNCPQCIAEAPHRRLGSHMAETNRLAREGANDAVILHRQAWEQGFQAALEMDR